MKNDYNSNRNHLDTPVSLDIGGLATILPWHCPMVGGPR
jgi:hypothetical protein